MSLGKIGWIGHARGVPDRISVGILRGRPSQLVGKKQIVGGPIIPRRPLHCGPMRWGTPMPQGTDSRGSKIVFAYLKLGQRRTYHYNRNTAHVSIGTEGLH